MLKEAKTSPAYEAVRSFLQTVACGGEVGAVAALAFESVAERHADEVTLQIVALLVVDPDVGHRTAAHFSAYERAAMGAAIHERVDRTISSACNHDRSVAHEICLEVARIGYLAFERDVVPDRTAKQPALLQFVDFLAKKNLYDTLATLGEPFFHFLVVYRVTHRTDTGAIQFGRQTASSF